MRSLDHPKRRPLLCLLRCKRCSPFDPPSAWAGSIAPPLGRGYTPPRAGVKGAVGRSSKRGRRGVVSSWVAGPGKGFQAGSKRKDPVGTTERPAKGAGGINTPSRGVNRCAWRVGVSCSNPLVGRLGGSRGQGRRVAGVSPPLPLATSRLVERGQGCLSWEWHILCHPLPPERLGRMFHSV